MKKYYSFAGQTVAMKDNGEFKYFLSDHLGSVSLVLDENGGILEQQRYLPFGAPRTLTTFASLTSTDFTYTGQRDLPGTGLMDYNARFYSPTLGRFTQPDSIIPGAANPQSWNRYSYVGNNPIRYNDPTGHIRIDGATGGCNASTCPLPPVDQGDYCDTHPGACGGSSSSSSSSVSSNSGGVPKHQGNGDIGDDLLALTAVNIPINEMEMCSGMKEFIRHCLYGSIDAVVNPPGYNALIFSPDTASVRSGDFMFSPSSFGFGNNSITSNLDINTWIGLPSYQNMSGKVGLTGSLDSVKLAIDVTVRFDSQYAVGNVNYGINTQIRPKSVGAVGLVAVGVFVAATVPEAAPAAIPLARQGWCLITQKC